MKTKLQDFAPCAEQVLSGLDQKDRGDAVTGFLFVTSFLDMDVPGFEPVRDLARHYVYLTCERVNRDRSFEWNRLIAKLGKFRWMLEDIKAGDVDSEIRKRFVRLKEAVSSQRDYLNGISLDSLDESDYKDLIGGLSQCGRYMESLMPPRVLTGEGCSQHKCRCGNGYFHAHQLCRHDIIMDGDGAFEENIEIYDSERPYGTFTCTLCGAGYEELSDIPKAPAEGVKAATA